MSEDGSKEFLKSSQTCLRSDGSSSSPTATTHLQKLICPAPHMPLASLRACAGNSLRSETMEMLWKTPSHGRKYSRMSGFTARRSGRKIRSVAFAM